MTMHLKSGTPRTNRGWSNQLWDNCPWQAIRDNPGNGFTFFTDFIEGNAADWTTNHIAGTSAVAQASAHGGHLTLSAGAATDTHGGNLALGAATSAFVTPSATTQIWMEFVMKQTLQTSTLGSGFWGLSTQATTAIPLTTTGALATSISRIGFSTLDSADLKFNYLRSGSTAYLSSAALDSCVTDEWMKLGFFYDGLSTIIPFINGLPQTTIATTATYLGPNAVMNFAFSIVSGGGTGTPTTTLDWVRLACWDESVTTITL